MKKLLFFLSFATILSCSSSDDNSDDSSNSNSDNKIDLPTWLKGLYKADRVYSQFPYPKSNPYSLNFIENDIFVKGSSNSEVISLKAFIENLKATGEFVSVIEVYNSSSLTNYRLIINYKNPYNVNAPYHYIWEISPRGDTGNLNVNYTKVENGNYGNSEIPYTKQ